MIPGPAVERLSRVYTFLTELCKSGCSRVSSRELEELSGFPAHTIRKDISYLGRPGPGGGNYRVVQLRSSIAETLGFDRKKRSCVVGLGQLGRMVLDIQSDEFDVLAGFDSNINVIELTETTVELFPAYLIPEKVRELNIELAVLAVPQAEVGKSVERLIRGGILGILNYTEVPIYPGEGVKVRNLYLLEELRILGAETRSTDSTSR